MGQMHYKYQTNEADYNVHITDVKRVNMTEKVATQMEEIYNKGRTAKNRILQGLFPDLGCKTDQR